MTYMRKEEACGCVCLINIFGARLYLNECYEHRIERAKIRAKMPKAFVRSDQRVYP